MAPMYWRQGRPQAPLLPSRVRRSGSAPPRVPGVGLRAPLRRVTELAAPAPRDCKMRRGLHGRVGAFARDVE